MAALEVARQQGSDYYTALCGYRSATVSVDHWVAESAVHRELPPPSAVLGWLQQAEAAHHRCKALLPKQWTCTLDSMKALAAPAKASLQHLQQQGDRWRGLEPAAQQEVDAMRKDALSGFHDPDSRERQLRCSGCGKSAMQLRTCGACREVQYCR